MSIFDPDYMARSILDITPAFLREKKINAILLDVDNTLAVHGKPEPAPGIIEWLKTMKDAGFAMMIVSNNTRKRVAPFADELDLSYTYWSLKPLPRGIRKACKKLKVRPAETAIIGDQILTDIVGGNLGRLTTILVEPFVKETSLLFRLKRGWERRYIKRYKKRKGEVK